MEGRKHQRGNRRTFSRTERSKVGSFEEPSIMKEFSYQSLLSQNLRSPKSEDHKSYHGEIVGIKLEDCRTMVLKFRRKMTSCMNCLAH